jgi:hypothetical protein
MSPVAAQYRHYAACPQRRRHRPWDRRTRNEMPPFMEIDAALEKRSN